MANTIGGTILSWYTVVYNTHALLITITRSRQVRFAIWFKLMFEHRFINATHISQQKIDQLKMENKKKSRKTPAYLTHNTQKQILTVTTSYLSLRLVWFRPNESAWSNPLQMTGPSSLSKSPSLSSTSPLPSSSYSTGDPCADMAYWSAHWLLPCNQYQNCNTCQILILREYDKMREYCTPKLLGGWIPSLYHIGTRVILPRHWGYGMVYKPEWCQKPKHPHIPIPYWYQKNI